MDEITRSEHIFEAFATLADTLVAGYDVLDLLQTLVDTCNEFLDVDSAGLLLENSNEKLELVASTSEANALVETMQLAADAGPCLDAFRTRVVVSIPSISREADRWTKFAEAAESQGIKAVHAIPLRLRETTIGTLNLMRFDEGALNAHDARAAKAFADVATIGILHERSLRDASAVRDQLQHALTSRIVIEQAKGVVAETAHLSMDEAFIRIRQHARSSQLPLRAVAQQLVAGELRF